MQEKIKKRALCKADTNATYEILLAQLEKYKELENDINFLSEFSNRDGKFADLAGFVRFNEKGEEVLSFGKYRNVTLKKIWKENPDIFHGSVKLIFQYTQKKIMQNFVTKIKLENKLNS